MNPNKKAQMQKTVIIVAAVILCANLLYTKHKNNKTRAAMPEGNFELEALLQSAASGVKTAVNVSIDTVKKSLERRERGFFRDPLKKPEELVEEEKKEPENVKVQNDRSKKDAVKKPDLKLEGVIWGRGERNIAILSGEVVREGDKIGAAEIIEIKRDRVIISIHGRQMEIKR